MHGLGRPAGWVGLGPVGSRFCSFRWIGLGWVEYDKGTIQTTKYYQKLLVVCTASAAQSESDFSSVRHTLTDVRSRMSAAKVE